MRMSSIENRMQCPAYALRVEGEPIIDEDSAPARIGSAAHEGIADYIDTGKYPSLVDTIRRWKITPKEIDDLRAAIGGAIALWDREVGKYFPNPQTEQEVRSPYLEGLLGEPMIGHPDVVSITSPETAAILDWKFGWGDGDYWGNMMGYGIGVCEQHGTRHVTLTLARTTIGIVETRAYSIDELKAWALTEFAPRVMQRDTYAPGEICLYCPRRLACPARMAMIRSVGEQMQPMVGGKATLQDLIPDLYDPARRALAGDQVQDLRAKLKIIETTIEYAKSELRNNVASMGPLPLPGGKALALVKSNRTSVDIDKAIAALEGQVAREEILGAATLSLSKVQDAAAKRAARGEGAAVRRSVEASLAAAGAVETTETETLREVRQESLEAAS